MKVRSALFIGRFQPFHLGHQAAIRYIVNDCNDYVIIGVGSSQEHHTADNPFTFKERSEMITSSLGDSINYTIVPIPNINDYQRWVKHVASLTPKFDVVYTCNKTVRNLFTKEGFGVREQRRDINVCASDIRTLMSKGDEGWKSLVPQGTLDTIIEVDGESRVRSAFGEKFSKPAVTVDALVVRESKVLLIKRKNDPFKDMWALPGGFVDYGESTEEAVARELLEETSLNAKGVRLTGVYSNPGRDPRGHIISLVYLVNAEGVPKAGDDTKEFKYFSIDNLPPMAFDHERIIRECTTKDAA